MSKHNDSFRNEIENIVNQLLADNSSSSATTKLRQLNQQLIQPDKAFLLNNLIYGGILREVNSLIQPFDRVGLNIILQQLKGKKAYFNSYALYYDLSTLLKDETFHQYSLVDELSLLYEQKTQLSSTTQAELNAFGEVNYEEKMDRLYDLTCDSKPPVDLSHFLLNTASHALLSLPDSHADLFNIQSESHRFSTIFPTNKVESTIGHIHYVRGLLRKVQGKETLYVDIQILPSGALMNLR